MIESLYSKVRHLILTIMRFGGLLLIFYNTWHLFYENSLKWSLAIFLLIVVGINDLIREKYFMQYEQAGRRFIIYSISYILSNIVNIYFSIFYMSEGTALYSIVLIVDLLMFNENIPRFLLMINAITYAIPKKINVDSQMNRTLIEITMSYCLSFAIVYIMRSLMIEKIRQNQLNEELMQANNKLKDYSEKIEELTITKERTRIAQELHDSIGHSLVALSMNLEFAENVVENEPQKTKEVLIKAHTISKDCMTKLREVVSILKEEVVIQNLRIEVQKLLNNFIYNDRYHFQFDMDEDIELESQEMKACIYKMVMESITNGMKHGKADFFIIAIGLEANDKNEKEIRISIHNNGSHTENLKKSNGLLGMEKRITELGGRLWFHSENQNGFTVQAVIPSRKGL